MYTNLFWTKIKMSHSSKTFFTGHSSRANSSRLHYETRSIGQSNHLTGRIAMLKTELQRRASFVYENEPASIGVRTNMAPMEVSADSGTKINLSMLVDFLLQKTYHDLTVLSELWVFSMMQLPLFDF